MENILKIFFTKKSIKMEELELRLQKAEEKALELEKKVKDMYHFIEMTDALTYDPKTSQRIRIYLKEEGVWK